MCECSRWLWLYIFIAELWFYCKQNKGSSTCHFTGRHASIYPHICLHLPPHSFIFTSEIPSLVLPGSVWWTRFASAPPHSDGPHAEPPSSQNTPPVKTTAAHPSEQLMAELSGAEETKAKSKTVRVKVPSLLHTPGSWLFLECGSGACSVLKKNVQSHVTVLHKHTHPDTHLPASNYFS